MRFLARKGVGAVYRAAARWGRDLVGPFCGPHDDRKGVGAVYRAAARRGGDLVWPFCGPHDDRKGVGAVHRAAARWGRGLVGPSCGPHDDRKGVGAVCRAAARWGDDLVWPFCGPHDDSKGVGAVHRAAAGWDRGLVWPFCGPQKLLAAAVLLLTTHAGAQQPAPQAFVLDQIAVTVDKQVITESDLVRFLRVAAFLDDKPVDLSAAARRTAAKDLVDQALMNMDAADGHLTLSTAQDVPPMLQQAKAQYPDAAAYQAALKKYGVTEQDVNDHLLAGLRALRFADLRFRPEVQIPDQDLRAAYDKFVAEWRASHKEPPASFEASQDGLEKLLTDQRTFQLLDQWLETARAEKHVDYREAAFQ